MLNAQDKRIYLYAFILVFTNVIFSSNLLAGAKKVITKQTWGACNSRAVQETNCDLVQSNALKEATTFCSTGGGIKIGDKKSHYRCQTKGSGGLKQCIASSTVECNTDGKNHVSNDGHFCPGKWIRNYGHNNDRDKELRKLLDDPHDDLEEVHYRKPDGSFPDFNFLCNAVEGRTCRNVYGWDGQGAHCSHVDVNGVMAACCVK